MDLTCGVRSTNRRFVRWGPCLSFVLDRDSNLFVLGQRLGSTIIRMFFDRVDSGVLPVCTFRGLSNDFQVFKALFFTLHFKSHVVS
jgi:hypothetical protein